MEVKVLLPFIFISGLFGLCSALTAATWVITKGKIYLPTTKIADLTDDQCVELCLKDPNCLGFTTYVCKEEFGYGCDFAYPGALFGTSSLGRSKMSYVKNSVDFSTGGSQRTGLVASDTTVSPNWSQRGKIKKDLGLKQSLTTCDKTPTIIQEDTFISYAAERVLSYTWTSSTSTWRGTLDMEGAGFTIDLGCTIRIMSLEIKNADYEAVYGRGSKNYTVEVSIDNVDYSTYVEGHFYKPCSDSSAGCPSILPETHYIAASETKARYIRFKAMTFYSTGAALAYLGVNSPQICSTPTYV